MTLNFSQQVKIFNSILGEDWEANEQYHTPSQLGGDDSGRPSFKIHVKIDEDGEKAIDWYDHKLGTGGNWYSLIKISMEVESGIVPSHSEIILKARQYLATQLIDSTPLENRLRKAKTKKPPVLKLRKKFKFGLAFWKVRGYTEKELNEQGVYELKSLTFPSSNFTVKSTKDNPAFVFTDKLNSEFYQLYRPLEKSKVLKFYSKSSRVLWGQQFLSKKTKAITIFGSRKDAMCAQKILPTDHIALNTFGESNTRLIVEQLPNLLKFTNRIYICNDNDEAGIKATKKLLELTNEIKVSKLFYSQNQGEDFDDTYLRLGINKLKKLLK